MFVAQSKQDTELPSLVPGYSVYSLVYSQGGPHTCFPAQGWWLKEVEHAPDPGLKVLST